MRLLILGGSTHHSGGVEVFSDRSREALVQLLGWQVDRMPTDTAYLTFERLPALLRNLAALVRYSRTKPDCIWLSYVTLPDLAFLVVAKALGLKVMVTPHLGSNWRSQSNPILRALSSWALRNADRVALLSSTQDQEIQIPKRVPRSHILTFLPFKSLEYDLPSSGTTLELQIIHAARLGVGKGTFMVLELCKTLQDIGVPFLCRIVGSASADTLSQLHNMIDEYELRDKVLVLGWANENDLLKHLRGSDVLVHLSRIDSYPLIVLEAMACSIFPIAMELAGARDMIENYDGLVVSLKSPVRETADFLAGSSVDELRRRSQIASAKVRLDYGWDCCVAAVEAALLATMKTLHNRT